MTESLFTSPAILLLHLPFPCIALMLTGLGAICLFLISVNLRGPYIYTMDINRLPLLVSRIIPGLYRVEIFLLGFLTFWGLWLILRASLHFPGPSVIQVLDDLHAGLALGLLPALSTFLVRILREESIYARSGLICRYKRLVFFHLFTIFMASGGISATVLLRA